MTKNNAREDWWKQAVVYQVYPRSFYDTDGDGLGDIRGVTAQMDYLRELGVDAIWLSPFYPSPLVDGGYDVANYRDVDPRLGTLEDFDEMASEGRACRRSRLARARPLHLPPRARRARRAAAQRLEVHLWRARLGAGRRR